MESEGVATDAGQDEEQDYDYELMESLLRDDEIIPELAEILALYQARPPPTKVRFVDDPYSASTPVQFATAYVTTDGYESCGSSFSDSSAYAMVNIDFRSVRGPGDASGCGCAEALESMSVLEADVVLGIQDVLDGDVGEDREIESPLETFDVGSWIVD